VLKIYSIYSIMASIYPYTFNGVSRIGNDNTDKSQKTIMNTRFNNYMLSTYFSDNHSSDHVQFATNQPAMMFTGLSGASAGINALTVDVDSKLNIHKENGRSLEKLSLQQRPFLTVPYLGRGSCDTILESQLKQGDIITSKKSVSTITEQSFANKQMYPLIDSIKDTITNPKYLVQEAALDGWVRGGSATRTHLPNNSGY
jgi:hypothetical protein